MFDFFDLGSSLEGFRTQACQFLEGLEQANPSNVHLAFSGGKSPIPFLEVLAGLHVWNHYTLSLVDDRIVPFHHEDSNARLIQEHLIDPVSFKWGIDVPFMPFFTQASLPYEVVLQQALDHYKQPHLAVLGMGLDGHTASLFPDAPEFEHAISTTDPLVLTTPQNAPHTRISLSLHALESCQELWLLISGTQKRAIFEEAAKELNPKLPISLILHSKKVLCHVFYTP
ncbi:6-phosphogluconolactonase [Helicobacter bizzozeronii]|uniref:6-phosphogluconolactonase n=1 Tax=Helicobacter bizzozeronii TaxID=56877 RepID=UPI000CEEF58D|nr:6-phosphogluconolactonase [Helicobacter bizzozeronii]